MAEAAEEEEPRAMLLSRAAVQKWLGIPRASLETLAQLHPEIIYRSGAGAKRFFRKRKVKEILLGE